MKAVILAHGSTERLQPICGTGSSALMPLPGGTALEHLLRLLQQHGIEQVCVTCRQPEDLPKGTLPPFTWMEVAESVGTAGAVAACRDWIAGDEVLVLPGNIVTDMDLTGAVAFHREKKALATLLIQPHPKIGRASCRERV